MVTFALPGCTLWHDIDMTSENFAPEGPQPDQIQQTRKSVFVVSPIGAPGTEVHRNASYALKYIFREALRADEWDVHRADEGESPDSIGQHVIRQLWEADLVIADLTGHNPNVFYELAIAHGWRKPVVHLIAKGETIPFDIVDQRTIFYDITDLQSVEIAVDLLRKYATYAIANTQELINPLTSFEKFSHIREDTADGGPAVADVLEKVVSRLSRLEQGLVRRDAVKDNQVKFPARSSGVAAAITEMADFMSVITKLEDEARSEEDIHLVNTLKAKASDALKEFSPRTAADIMKRASTRQSLVDGQILQ
ncbi:hypothetical protein QMY03_08755 [Arthrobacter sp. KFRI-F3372]|nr:hypothetical protein QMY03_08755 [Arthrobacter sp. KFRI-F3372]